VVFADISNPKTRISKSLT